MSNLTPPAAGFSWQPWESARWNGSKWTFGILPAAGNVFFFHLICAYFFFITQECWGMWGDSLVAKTVDENPGKSGRVWGLTRQRVPTFFMTVMYSDNHQGPMNETSVQQNKQQQIQMFSFKKKTSNLLIFQKKNWKSVGVMLVMKVCDCFPAAALFPLGLQLTIIFVVNYSVDCFVSISTLIDYLLYHYIYIQRATNQTNVSPALASGR